MIMTQRPKPHWHGSRGRTETANQPVTESGQVMQWRTGAGTEAILGVCQHRHTLRATLSGTFLQTLPDLVTPLSERVLFISDTAAVRHPRYEKLKENQQLRTEKLRKRESCLDSNHSSRDFICAGVNTFFSSSSFSFFLAAILK